MRILFVSETYYPHLNGVYYFVARLGPLLQEKGHQVAVIAPSEKNELTKNSIDGMDVYGMPSLPLLYYPKLRFTVPVLLQSRMRRLINDFKPDVIHIQDHFILSKAVVAVNKKMHIPIVGTNHFMPENLTALFKNKMAKKMIESFMWSRFAKVFNQASFVTTPTETGAQLIRPKLHKNVIAISSGISLQEFNPFGSTDLIREKYALPNKPVLLFVGRIDPEKHIDELLKAVAIALKIVDFCFVVVGKGVEKAALETLAEELRIKESVIFTGFVPNEELPFLYKLSHSFAIASTAELLSLATLQAIATGLPVVAVEAGALVELVQDKENGYLYKAGNINSLAQKISSIFEDEDSYRAMSQKSLAVSRKHDINQTVASFEKLYASCFSKEVKVIGTTMSPTMVTNIQHLN